ncbi:MAG: YMGG-like glycine zipper-containing protein [Pyrinomonadaceae bacterium]
MRRIICVALVWALCGGQLVVPARVQRRRPAAAPARRTSTRRPPTTAAKTAAPANLAAIDPLLTGVYQLDQNMSDDPQEAVARAAGGVSRAARAAIADRLLPRLTSPTQLTLQRRGRVIDIASTRAPRITFEADGQTHIERAADGHIVHTRARLIGASLEISSRGSVDDEFIVTFDPQEQGERLRVTRRIFDAQLPQPVLVESVYDKTGVSARFDIYGQPETAPTSARNRQRQPPPNTSARNRPVQPPQPPPVLRPRAPEPAPPVNTNTVFTIGRNTQFVTVLNDDLDTARTRPGDHFTLTVREPAQFAGATIEGTVARVTRGGRINGRSELALNFERIRLRDGRTADFNGVVEAVQTMNGAAARVDPEGNGEVQERGSQTNRTVERAAIGAAVGAIIGAIANGGKGAAIGAAIGAGAGAGSVYIQGRDDLALPRGTEVTLRGNTNQ